MKKYYISHIDFSEIEAVSTDEFSNENAVKKLTESGAINSKGKPDAKYLNTLSNTLSPSFFSKLIRRLARRRGGIRTVYDTLLKLQNAKEYTAMYLYIVIYYGFVEWQVPELIACLPAAPDALKVFLGEFMDDFDEFLRETAGQENAEAAPSVGDDSE